VALKVMGHHHLEGLQGRKVYITDEILRPYEEMTADNLKIP
jgi:hypothetical protein